MPEVKAARGQVYYRGGGWRFRIKGANGEVIANGEAYSKQADAKAAAKALLPEGAPLDVTPKGDAT